MTRRGRNIASLPDCLWGAQNLMDRARVCFRFATADNARANRTTASLDALDARREAWGWAEAGAHFEALAKGGL